jgi:CBS domain containing-hemolysin-like protein
MVEAGGLRLTVEQVTGRRIRKVRATRAPEAEARSDEGADHS